MQQLTGFRQSYDWGSKTSMFSFLGSDPDGEPFAELWFGAHPLAPATISSAATGLDEFILEDQKQHLGDKVKEKYGCLPYLVKLLAPERPLSIQVHPNPDMAREGFRVENTLGRPISHPHRSFKDEHHKPEMVYAITPFNALAGFRPHREVALIMEAIGKPLCIAYEAAVVSESKNSLRAHLEHLLHLDEDEVDRVIRTCRTLATSHSHPVIKAACKTVDELSLRCPGDVGAVVSLLLNRVKLRPGQTLFIADGVPHAYLGGFGLEVMANSDNVLRLGLTTKNIDVPNTLKALDFASAGYRVDTAPLASVTHIFRAPVDEFALSISHPHLAIAGSVLLPGDGPRIVVCLQGAITLSTSEDPQPRQLLQGHSVFIGANEGSIHVSGQGSVAGVFVPIEPKSGRSPVPFP